MPQVPEDCNNRGAFLLFTFRFGEAVEDEPVVRGSVRVSDVCQTATEAVIKQGVRVKAMGAPAHL